MASAARRSGTAASALHNNNHVDSGAGTWAAAGNTAWTDFVGATNAAWTPDGCGVQARQRGHRRQQLRRSHLQRQFAVDGYTVTSQPLTTVTADTVFASATARAPAPGWPPPSRPPSRARAGSKTDLRHPRPLGDNTYTGGTPSRPAGSRSGAGGPPAVVGAITNAVLTFNRSDTLGYSDVISGTGR
jgi:hypothetical protein